MDEKIEKIRDEFIEKINNVDEGIHILLNYNPKVLESIIFETENGKCIFDQHGNRKKEYKVFALPKNVLRKIDFSNIDFSNFKAYEYDFTGLYNVRLNPQTIWERSLKGSTLNGVEFIGPFDGVFLCRTNFSGSKGAVIEPIKLGRRYRDIEIVNCIFKDVTFIGPIRFISKDLDIYFSESMDIAGSDFTGSTGAVIYPNALINNGLSYCILKDATLATPIKIFKNLVGDKHMINIKGTNFTGAKQRKLLTTSNMIQLYCIRNMNFTDTDFNGVHFMNPIADNTILNNTSFKGSTGAIIDLSKINNERSDISTCDFTDSTVIGDNKEKLIITEDGKLSKEFAYELDNFLGIVHTKELITKEDLEKSRLELIKKRREEILNKIKEVINLNKSLESLEIEPKLLYGSIPFDKDLFLVKVDNHYEINRNVIDSSLLRFFNIAPSDLENVKVTGIDFRKCRFQIDPQIVYNKDISNCIFDDNTLSPFASFKDVKMDNTDFSLCSYKPIVRKI